MLDGRKIQFFCDAIDAISGDNNTPYPLEPADGPHWDTFKEACTTHKDCIDKGTEGSNDKQLCTPFIWDALEDGSAFGVGSACYSYDDPATVCPDGTGTPSFATLNENFENTTFSYYT